MNTVKRFHFVIWVYLPLLFLNFKISASAQPNFFDQSTSLNMLKTSVDQLYNFEFDNATKTINEIKDRYPDHPAILIFDCLKIYWMNFPVSGNAAASTSFEHSLIKAQEKAKAFLKTKEDDPEKIFYLLFIDILLARNSAAEDHQWDAASYALDAYRLIKKGFTLQEKFSEFYFSTGLYKYYREFFPEQNNVYKPIAWALGFPSGDKVKGLEYLDKAVRQTVFVAPEALLYASSINLKYENNLPKALAYAEIINNKYPKNLYFKVLYIENLIQSGSFKKAETCLAEIAAPMNNYYKLPHALFKGMLEERFYRRPAEAEIWYQEAIKAPSNWDSDNYIGLAYYGLGNIYQLRGDKEKAKKYYRKANSLCEYLLVKKATDKY